MSTSQALALQEYSSSVTSSSLVIVPFAFSPLEIVTFVVAVVDVLLTLDVAAVVDTVTPDGFDVGAPTLLYTTAAAAA